MNSRRDGHRISVVVVNYNYEQFVGTAVSSALALEWDDVEVIVVDDGSTDGSREVIRSFGDSIVAIMTENASQRVAVNRGFAASTGDVVIFLDSDDVLPADLPRHLFEVWTPAASKVQFRMQRIDARGVPFGKPFPSYFRVPSPEAIRDWARRTTAYPTPPGSGNAYSRRFLECILPVDSGLGNAADSACLAAAPFLGDVLTAPGAIVGYRRHDANDSDLLADSSRFAREVTRARARWLFASRFACEHGADPTEKPLFRSRELLQLRIAAARTTPDEHPLPGDDRARMLRDVLLAPFHPGPEGLVHRLKVTVWCVITLLAPRPVVTKLLGIRYGRPH